MIPFTEDVKAILGFLFPDQFRHEWEVEWEDKWDSYYDDEECRHYREISDEDGSDMEKRLSKEFSKRIRDINHSVSTPPAQCEDHLERTHGGDPMEEIQRDVEGSRSRRCAIVVVY
jgi:hypothetical protein